MDALQHPPGFERYCRTVNPYWGALLSALGLERPWVDARSCWLTDDLGRRYLDLSAGFGTAVFGHRPLALRRALRRALAGRGGSVAAFGWSAEAAEVAERLLALAGGGLAKAQFFSTGAESIEAAVKFATVATGRAGVLGLAGGFHGLTGVATALAGGGPWRERLAMPFAAVETLSTLDPESVRTRLMRRDLAAVVVEPIQHMAGMHEQEEQTLIALADACRDSGTLLILDEVMSGLGRSGRWFAFQHHPALARPDMLVLSKALTGGLVPVSALLCTDAVFDAMFAGPGRARIHGATFAGNPLAMVCARAALEEAVRIDACARARHGEAVLRSACARGDRDGPIALRGRGLMLAATPVGLPPERSEAFWWGLRDHGILLLPAAHRRGAFVLTPPLIIDERSLRRVARIMIDVARAIARVPD